MALSPRIFVIDQEDRIYRLAMAKFEKMLRNPGKQCFPQFAGKRLRAAQALIESSGGEPRKVIRTSFHMFAFDPNGFFDAAAYLRQESSRAEAALMPALTAAAANTAFETPVVEAEARFVARGGSWEPSRALLRAIRDAALGELKCPRF